MVAVLLKTYLVFLQLPLDLKFRQMVIDRPGHPAGIRFPILQAFPEFCQPFHRLFTDLVQILKFFFLHAPKRTLPLPVPAGKAPDSPGDHIIFQPVGLFSFHSGHTASKHPEHGFIGKILLDHCQKRPQKFHKGIF